MKLSDSLQFYTQLRKVLALQAANWTQVLRKLVLVAPTPNAELRFKGPKKWNEYLYLILISWYLPEEYRALCQVYLHGYKNKFGTDKVSVVLTLLNSEPEMILYIGECTLFKDTRHLFGFLGQPIEFGKYQFYFQTPKKPRKMIRKKGYQDHGSRRPDHKWQESRDYTLTELQLEIEAERQLRQDLSQLNLGGLP